MSLGPQYTSCVDLKDFQPLNKTLLGIVLGAALIVGGVASLFSALGILVITGAGVQALRYVLDWMLNGKLVCLHRQQTEDCTCSTDGTQVCAIGWVADTEDVGEDKNPIEDVDNDFAINILLAPVSIADLIGKSRDANLATARADPAQGDLLRQPDGIPNSDRDLGWDGYTRSFVTLKVTGETHSKTEVVGRDYGWGIGPDRQTKWENYITENTFLGATAYEVPVLHCEFEGTRIRDLLDVIDAFSLGGGWCKKNFFFRILCAIMQTILSPIILAALLIAWAAAKGGQQSDALADPAGGEVGPRDTVIVRGRWAYDSAHAGYNEIHATRIVQKVFNVPTNPGDFKKFQKAWCDRLSEVPHVVDPGVHPVDDTHPDPAGMTDTQRGVYDQQGQPQNQWVFHPAIDGCQLARDGRGDPGTAIR
jgi:hypothetical protein